MQRGGFVPAFIVDTLIMKKNGVKYEPVSVLDKLMRNIETRLGAPIYSSPSSEPNQMGSELRRRRIAREKKRVTKKRVTKEKKRKGVHSRRIV
jgi:hypothetical protein